MSGRTFVDRTEEFDDDERRLVEVDGTDVCVVCLDDEYYAFRNTCPHFSGPVGKGEILPEIELEEDPDAKLPKERYSERPLISCPWHGWEFDLETGVHCGHDSPEFNLPTYDVVVESGDVFVVSD